MKIAILDDNRSFASVLKEILVFKGHLVKVFYNGLDLSTDKYVKQYDMIIVDLYLPDQYGLSVIKELREKSVDSTIVVASVDFSDTAISILKELGIKHILKKPFNYEDLDKIMMSIEKIENLIDEFINNSKDEKRILILTDGGNYRVLHKLTHLNYGVCEKEMEESDENEIFIIDGLNFKILPDFFNKIRKIQRDRPFPKVVILLKEDLTKFREMLSERPESKDLIIKSSFIIDLMYAMS
ncbi:TPA: hypothetical protein DCW38_00420 [candidate division WOR-3 bacterium]|jgi:DNA-binding NarL/FixJ family response regulator|uniref:Response regulatory domain-containing protein n=1 Tax=candidate division WOR-3 bacterium TaxID=2052148 RepID=A0A350H7X4_UNCW3|nr:hypothetical protein [candidate division WOR-3 bacterium]